MIHIICKDTELYDKSKLRIFLKNTYKVYMITPHAHLENKTKKEVKNISVANRYMRTLLFHAKKKTQQWCKTFSNMTADGTRGANLSQ